jgi:hypothetical protein
MPSSSVDGAVVCVVVKGLISDYPLEGKKWPQKASVFEGVRLDGRKWKGFWR